MNTLFSSRVAENANSRRRCRLIFDTPAHVAVPSNNDNNNNNNNNSNALVESAGAESKPAFQRLASWMENREDPFGADVPTPIPPFKLPNSSPGSRSSVTISNSNSNSNAEYSDIIQAPHMKRQNAQGEPSPRVSVFSPGMERQNAHSGEDPSEGVLPLRLERQLSHPSRHSSVREVSSFGVGSLEGTSREEDTVDSDWSQLRASSFDSCASQIETSTGIIEFKDSDTRTLPPQTHCQQIASSKIVSAGLMHPMPAVLLAGTNAVPMLSTLANGVLVNQVPFGRSADGRSVTVAVALPGNRNGLTRRKERRKLWIGGSTGSAGRKQTSRGLSEVDIPLTPFNPFGDSVDDTELRQSQPAGGEQSSDLSSESLRIHEFKPLSSRAGILGGALGEDSEDSNDADDERLDALSLSDVDNLSEDGDILVTEPAIDEMQASKLPNRATTSSTDIIREDYFNGADNTLAATGAALHSIQTPLVRLPRSTSVGGKPALLHQSCIDLQLPHAPTSTPLLLPLSISRPIPPNRSLSEHNHTRQGLRVVPSIVVSSSPYREFPFTSSVTDAVLAGNGNGLTNHWRGEDVGEGVDVRGVEETKKVYLGGAAKQVQIQTVQAPSVVSQCATPIQMHDDIDIRQIHHAESESIMSQSENGSETGNEIQEIRRSAFVSREDLVEARNPSHPNPLPGSQTQTHNHNSRPSNDDLMRPSVDEEENGSGRLSRSNTFGRNMMGKIRRLGHLKKRSSG